MLNVGVEGIMLLGSFLAALGAVTSGSPWAGLGLAGGRCADGRASWVVCDRTARRPDRVGDCVGGARSGPVELSLPPHDGRCAVVAPGVPRARPRPAFGDTGGRLDPVSPEHSRLPDRGATPASYGSSWRVPLVGLAIRACGENPEAAEAEGVNVNAVRFACVVLGGALAGVGGAYLAIAQINSFIENMVVGRGFIAIACVVFGRWHPFGTLAAAIGFGLTEAAQIRLQIWYPAVPYQFFVMLPYVLAIGALVFMARSAALPRALGRTFVSERDA